MHGNGKTKLAFTFIVSVALIGVVVAVQTAVIVAALYAVSPTNAAPMLLMPLPALAMAAAGAIGGRRWERGGGDVAEGGMAPAGAPHFVGGLLIAGAACFVLLFVEIGFAQSAGFQLSRTRQIIGWSMVVTTLASLPTFAVWRARRGERGWLPGVLTGIALGALPVSFCAASVGMLGK